MNPTRRKVTAGILGGASLAFGLSLFVWAVLFQFFMHHMIIVGIRWEPIVLIGLLPCVLVLTGLVLCFRALRG